MNITDKKYFIPNYRTLLLGCSSLFCGFFTLWLLAQPVPKFDISYLFLIPVIGIISATTIYFGGKTIINCNKFVQLELKNNEIKYDSRRRKRSGSKLLC